MMMYDTLSCRDPTDSPSCRGMGPRRASLVMTIESKFQFSRNQSELIVGIT